MKYLCDKAHWAIEGNPDLVLFFRNLPGLFQEGAILAISGSSLETVVKDYLNVLKVKPSKGTRCEPYFLGPEAYHIPITVNNLNHLADIAENHAEPEVADHIIVYRDTSVLLEWYDVGSNPIWLARDIAKETADDFGRAIGCEIKAVNKAV